MKIGVLSDTHIPDLLPEMPARVLELLKGVDIILHAGDISDIRVLQQLEQIAQTFAVCGNCESPQVARFLQESQRLEFANRAIGLVHGHRAWVGKGLDNWRMRLSARVREQALHAHVLKQFDDVHTIVYGHTHRPYMKMHGGVLLFNPGAVAPARGQLGSLGFLEIGANTIKGRIVQI